MKIQDVAAVLAKAAIFDFRTVGEADIMAWFEVIGDLDADLALAAVSRWYRDRSDRLMPAHLREAVKLVLADRRLAARIAEAAAEPTRSPAEEAPRRLWGELGTEDRQRLLELSGGLLGGLVAQERWPSAAEAALERFDAD